MIEQQSCQLHHNQKLPSPIGDPIAEYADNRKQQGQIDHIENEQVNKKTKETLPKRG